MYYAFTCFLPSRSFFSLFICVLHSCVCKFVSHLLVSLGALLHRFVTLIRISRVRTTHLPFPRTPMCVTNIRPSDTSFICPSSPTSHRSSGPFCHFSCFFKVPSPVFLCFFASYKKIALILCFFFSSTSLASASQALVIVLSLVQLFALVHT